MPKYRKKPVDIDAFQFTDENNPPLGVLQEDVDGYKAFYIQTLEGKLYTKVGDYIITGVKGEQYSCRKDIFEETYIEMVEKLPGT